MADDTKTCPTCDGSGKILDGNRNCPDCDGTGLVSTDRAARLTAQQRYAEAYLRAEMSAAEINDLPDSAFAYIEPGGEKDDDGKTTPRKLRHYPIHDKPHADNALSRANAQVADGDDDAKAIAQKALPAIKAAVKKFADDDEQKSTTWNAQHRDGMSYGDMNDMLCSAVTAKFCRSDDDWAWVCDFGNNWVVYSLNGEKFRCSYAINGTTCTLGDPEPVRTVTSYVTMETKARPMPKGVFSRLVEQPPPHIVPIEVRMAASDATTAEFVGYASTTGESYAVRDWLGEYGETIMPGAFAKTLREQAVIPLLFNHDGMPMASTGSGTSRLSEDAKGLRNEATLDRRQALTNDLCIALQRGDVNKMSFSYRAIKDTWNDSYDDRQVQELQAYDTSIVTYPANSGTSAELLDAMRSALGREGLGLMWSLRSALPQVIETRELPNAAGDVLEQALKALVQGDEILCRSHGPQGRARTFLVAHAMLELRAGAVLSGANKALLTNALDALSAADKTHAKLAGLHQKAAGAVADVLDSASKDTTANSDPDGLNGNQGAGNGNPINPQDGAGPRSLQLARERDRELRRLRG